MILEKFPEVLRLSPAEKLLFVSELWNDLEAQPSQVPVSREVIAELDQRMEQFRQHPEQFTTWEAVKERILGFLYGIFYTAQPARLVIAAIMDLRQDPRAIRRKLLP
jgi:putative addiction module component (TIGR02574 family)